VDGAQAVTTHCNALNRSLHSDAPLRSHIQHNDHAVRLEPKPLEACSPHDGQVVVIVKKRESKEEIAE
jgi:hypothetical protein